MKKLHDGEASTIIKSKRGVAKKLLKGWWTSEHYALYNQFAAQHDYCVKVLDYKSRYEFEMEHLDIHTTVGNLLEKPEYADLVTPELLADVLRIYSRIYVDCLEFSKQFLYNRGYFMHKDLHVGNIVLTKQKEIKLIDPDSFEIQKNPMCPKHFINYNRIMLGAAMHLKL